MLAFPNVVLIPPAREPFELQQLRITTPNAPIKILKKELQQLYRKQIFFGFKTVSLNLGANFFEVGCAEPNSEFALAA
jgi:hypothetical protein